MTGLVFTSNFPFRQVPCPTVSVKAAHSSREEVAVRKAARLRHSENALAVHELHATILKQIGIDQTKITCGFQGRGFRLRRRRERDSEANRVQASKLRLEP